MGLDWIMEADSWSWGIITLSISWNLTITSSSVGLACDKARVESPSLRACVGPGLVRSGVPHERVAHEDPLEEPQEVRVVVDLRPLLGRDQLLAQVGHANEEAHPIVV